MCPTTLSVACASALAGTIRLTTELGHGRVERARGQLIERALAQFFIEHLDGNRAAVACPPDVIEKPGHIELAFAAESPVIYSVFDQVPGSGECAVIMIVCLEGARNYVGRIENVAADYC